MSGKSDYISIGSPACSQTWLIWIVAFKKAFPHEPSLPTLQILYTHTMSESKAFPTLTPVQFSPNLLDSLDKSTDSTVTRQQRQSQAISAQVGKQLDELLSEKAEKLDKTIESKLLAPESDKQKLQGSPELNAKLDSIYNTLKQSAEAKVAKSPSVLAAEKAVSQCLLKNKGTPLNCWDEVQSFKKLAGNP